MAKATTGRPALQDYGKMSVEQLQAAIQSATEALEEKRKEQEQEIIAQVRELTARVGRTPEELFGGRGKGAARATRRSPAPKYRHPKDAGLTWTGRGKKPLWVVAALEGGKKLEDLAIS